MLYRTPFYMFSIKPCYDVSLTARYSNVFYSHDMAVNSIKPGICAFRLPNSTAAVLDVSAQENMYCNSREPMNEKMSADV